MRVLVFALLVSTAWADDDPGILHLVIGHGTPSGFEVAGRLIEDKGVRAAGKNQSRLRNAWRQFKQFESDEIEKAQIQIELLGRKFTTRTDEEGTFVFRAKGLSPKLPPGQHIAKVTVTDDRGHPTPPAEIAVTILPDEGAVGLISDFDDTVVVSNVESKRALIKSTVFKNAKQLTMVGGADTAYQAAVKAGASIVFYVSGSPHNLLPRLQTFIEYRGLPPGPVLLKDFGTDPLFDQTNYKLGRIRRIMEMHPKMRFVLIGDSGEADPEIYAQVRGYYPDRVLGILIRRAGGKQDPLRFKGMTVVNDFTEQPALLAVWVRDALAPKAP